MCLLWNELVCSRGLLFSIINNWFIILKNCSHCIFWEEKEIFYLKATFFSFSKRPQRCNTIKSAQPVALLQICCAFFKPYPELCIFHIARKAHTMWQALAVLVLWAVEVQAEAWTWATKPRKCTTCTALDSSGSKTMVHWSSKTPVNAMGSWDWFQEPKRLS